MNRNIYTILKDAGVAHGLAQEEVFAMMAMGNEGLLNAVKEAITAAAKQSGKTASELGKTLSELDVIAREYRRAQAGAIRKVSEAKRELMNEYVVNETEVKKEEVKKSEAMQRKLAVFLAQNR